MSVRTISKSEGMLVRARQTGAGRINGCVVISIIGTIGRWRRGTADVTTKNSRYIMKKERRYTIEERIANHASGERSCRRECIWEGFAACFMSWRASIAAYSYEILQQDNFALRNAWRGQFESSARLDKRLCLMAKECPQRVYLRAFIALIAGWSGKPATCSVLSHFTLAEQGTWGIHASSWFRMYACKMSLYKICSIRY